MSESNEDLKKKHLVITGVGGGILLIGTVAAIFLMDGNKEAPQPTTVKTTEIATPGQVEDKDAWRAQQAAQEQSNEAQIAQLQQLLEQQAQNSNDMSKEMIALREQLSNIEQQRMLNQSANITGSFPPPPLNSNPSGKSEGIMGTQILPDPTGKGRSNNFPPSPLGSSAQELNPQQLTPPIPKQIEVIDFKEGAVEGANTTGTTAAQDHRAVSSPAEKETFIPATTFVRALLLNGVDAPTGGQAQGNPLPITLQIIDAANLPNKNKINLKGCRFLGAAWGDLSSERMLARVENMSCVINGKGVVVPVRGYVIGEDGKTGVRGRLVSKQGQALANSLLAGVASSTANVFAAGSSSQSVSTNALGGTTTTKVVDQDDLKRAAIGGGLSSAAQNLAEYYIRQAEKMYPVIETDAGRIVEVLITDGVAFPLTNSDKRVKPSEKRVLSND